MTVRLPANTAFSVEVQNEIYLQSFLIGSCCIICNNLRVYYDPRGNNPIYMEDYMAKGIIQRSKKANAKRRKHRATKRKTRRPVK